MKEKLFGHFSVIVGGNWRMTFRFEGEDVVLVNYHDYHSIINMKKMFNPPHPGLTLRDDVLPALGISVTAAAEQLGVTRPALFRVLIASVWLSQQTADDLWKARKTIKPKVKHVLIPELLAA